MQAPTSLCTGTGPLFTVIAKVYRIGPFALESTQNVLLFPLLKAIAKELYSIPGMGGERGDFEVHLRICYQLCVPSC